MQVEQVVSEKLKRQYNITVPANDVESEVASRLSAVAKELKMPGFRPGKVPMEIVKKNHGQRVMGEVLEIVVDRSSREALVQQDVRPALRPKIEILGFEEGSDLTYKMEFEILPDVPELDLTTVEIERPKAAPGEAEVEEALGKIAEQSKTFKAVKRVAKNGDAVKIDFEGFVGDEAFEGGAGKDFQLELGSSSFIPGFEEQLVGAKAGDNVDVNVTFPEEYHSDDLAGKESLFKVLVHEVLSASKAKVDDALAKTLGFEAGVDALKEAVKGQISKEIDAACRSHAKKNLFDVLNKKYDFDVPEEMEKMEFDAVWKQVQEAKKEDPDAEEFAKSDEELEKEYKEMAHRRVQLGILLSDFGRKNEIEIGQDEISEAVMNEARQFPGQEQKVFEYYRENPEHLEALKGPILEEKVVDFMLEKVSVTDNEVTVEELQNL